MNLNCAPWHAEEFAQLAAQSANSRLPHAMLIHGPQGVGKSRFAQAIAASLLCADNLDWQACGHCKSCRLLLAGSHPDYLLLAPLEEGKQIVVDQVRALGEFMSRTAGISTCKVAVLDPAEVMNRNAANSLLKCLEEPPGASYLVLATSALTRLTATVRSRCQLKHLGIPQRDLAQRWLDDQVGESAEDLLEAATGRPLLAMEMHINGTALQERDLQAAVLKFLSDESSLAACVEAVRQRKPVELLTLLQYWLQDLARWLACGEGAALKQSASTQWCRVLAPRVSPREVQQLLQATVEATRMAASTANPNEQLLLEDLMIRWRQAMRY